jgi:hypothetical protein
MPIFKDYACYLSRGRRFFFSIAPKRRTRMPGKGLERCILVRR